MLLQYGGSVTDRFVKRLKDVGASTQVVLTLRKIKTFLPSLKAPVPKMMKSNIVYQVTCPRCCHARQVGKTSRHCCIRFGEHRTKKAEPVFKHVRSCGGDPKALTEEDIEVLATATKGALHLAIMEALYIRELSPGINVKDELRDHELSLKF